MKKITIIIGIVILVSGGYFVYQSFTNPENKKIKQAKEVKEVRENELKIAEHIFTKNNYKLSIKYNDKKWEVDETDVEDYEYVSYLDLIYKDNEKDRNNKKIISFRYELNNNGDDTPYEAGDTGGGTWPPQPEKLINDFNEKEFTFLGKYLGKELYVENKPEKSVGVYQKLSNGKITARTPLLSKDQERVNYYDYFSIKLVMRNVKDEKEKQKLYQEFLQILKSMKIEKIGIEDEDDGCTRSIPEALIDENKVISYKINYNKKNRSSIETFILNGKKIKVENIGCEYFGINIYFNSDKKNSKEIYNESSQILQDLNNVFIDKFFDEFIIALRDYANDFKPEYNQSIYTRCKEKTYCIDFVIGERESYDDFLAPYMIVEKDDFNKIKLNYIIGPL